MIVTCEGCETSFHVGDGLVKPTGSKVRCSKCRHVFTAYAPAQEADAAEPLTLTDELQAEAAPTESPAQDEIGSELDALFAAADAEEFDSAVEAEDAPELLNVDELTDSTAQGPDRIGGPAVEEEEALDLDLDLDIL